MRTKKMCWLITMISFGCSAAIHADVIKQQPGSHFLAFEAENYDELGGDPDAGGWLEVFPDEEFESLIGNPVLPEDSNVSGSAMFDQDGGSNFVDVLNYRLEFAEAGIYSVYLRYTMFDMINETSYGNEDSFYLPLELDEPAEQDGWFSLAKHGHDDSSEDPPYWEGQFHWMGPFNFNSGEPVEYEVDTLGQALDFQISQRERGSTLDAVVFSTEIDLFEDDLDEILESIGDGGPGLTGDFNNNGELDLDDINALTAQSASGANNLTFDVNDDQSVNGDDVNFWIKDLANSWVGDADFNLEFNSGDFVGVFQAGKYETGAAAVWSEGDWDGNGVFDSGDFVLAFQDGGYERGPATASVPEPSSLVIFCIGMLCLMRHRRQ